jgi:hypothetical protein
MSVSIFNGNRRCLFYFFFISVDVLLRSYQIAIPGDTHPLMSRELVMWLAITKFDLKYAGSMIDIDYYMALTRADKGYDMKNEMLWYVYHILQQRK